MMRRFTKSLFAFFLFTIISLMASGQGDITIQFWYDDNCNNTKNVTEPFITGPDMPVLWDVALVAPSPIVPVGNVFPAVPDGMYELQWVNPVSNDWHLSSPGSGITPVTVAGANVTAQAAYFKKTKLTHFAWVDVNGDGVQDAGEPGLPGLTVTLSGNDFCGAPPAVAVATDLGGGIYEFAGVNPSGPAGYTINFDLLTGYQRTSPNETSDALDSDPVIASGNVTSVDVEGDGLVAELADIDAGYWQFSTLSDFVFEDINGNGVNDGEPGIDGVTVTLSGFDGDGDNVMIVDVTAGGGFYEFDLVPPGPNYKIDFTLPSANHFFTRQNLGGDDNFDSDPNPANGEVTGIVVLSGDPIVDHIDAGMYQGAEISNFVWEDLNGDGDQDGGEPGFAGITVAISGNDGAGVPIVRPNQVTVASGLYLFDELPPGTYTITFSNLPALHFWTDPDLASGDDNADSDVDKVTGAAPPQLLISDQVVTNIDAGLFEAVKIGDLVWDDLNGNGIKEAAENGLNGVTVSIELSTGGAVTKADGTPAADVITAGAGAYLFDILKPGSYIVTFQAFAPYFRTLQNIGAEPTDSDADIVTGETAVITLTSGMMNLEVDAGYFKAGRIADVTWEDLNGNGLQDGEPGLDGVSISIADAAGMAVNDALGAAIAPVVSAAGMYEFINLRPGTYVLTFTAPGGYFPTKVNAVGSAVDAGDSPIDSDCNQANSNKTHDIIISSDENQIDIDAGFYKAATLGNFVWHDQDADGIQDAGEPGQPGITVTLANADMSPLTDVNNAAIIPAITGAAGDYLFTNLRPGVYKVTIGAAGWLFSIADNGGDATDSDFNTMGMTVANRVLVSDQDDLDLDAGIYKNVMLCGTIWVDNNTNGTFEIGPPSEGVFGGVTVNLTGMAGDGMAINLNVVSLPTGEYCFTVKPGDYVVSLPASNFGPGNPLGSLESCVGQLPANDDVDNDDNGAGEAPTTSTTIELRCGLEPENMGLTNNSVDFCFAFDCNEPNDFAALSCETVPDTFCNLSVLNGFCSRMPNMLVQPAPSPLCPGTMTVPNNMSWFAFIAGDGAYTITVDPFDCVPGPNSTQLGVQTGIYEDCSFTNALFCNGGCSQAPVVIPSTALVPGNTYYFFIDGCAGSICSYNVDVSNFTEYIIPEPADIVCASGNCTPICPNNKITLQVNATAPKTYTGAVLKFTWRVTDPMGIDTFVTTTTDQLEDYLLDKVGNWKFEILEVANKCNASTTIKEFNVVVRNPPDEDFGTVTLCEKFVMGWAGPSADASGNPDPNGDGFPGWQVNPTVFTGGPAPGAVNTVTYPGTGAGQEGCVYKQTVRLIKIFNSVEEKINIVLCPGEVQIIGGVIPVDNNRIDEKIVLPDAAANGCDSLILLNSIVLEAIDGTINNLGCQNGKTKFQLSGEILPNAPNIGTLMTTYRWLRVETQTYINDGNLDGDPKTILLAIPGEYICEIVMKIGNKECVSQRPFEFIPASLLPTPTKVGVWNDNFCAGTLTTSYEATSNEPNPQWEWSYPAGVTVTGQTSNKINITWGNVLGGEICVSIKDNCGTSEQLCDTVRITKVPTSRFVMDDKICIDSFGIAAHSVIPATAGATYTWTTDSGTRISAAGINDVDTIAVKWETAGKKFVTLVVTNNGPNGLKCPSLPYRDSIEVVPRQAPVEVICDPDETTVTYTWINPTGMVGLPIITVLNGPSGVLAGNNSYLITGQLPGVDSEISVQFNNNHACGLISTVSGCRTQNCVEQVATFNPIPDLCLTPTTPTINLKDYVSGLTTTDGIFTFTSSTTPTAIIDGVNGIFDPKLAGAGTHQVRVVYKDLLGCVTAAKFSSITVLETPTSDFTVTSPICQDSFSTMVYTGNVTSGANFDWDFGADVSQPGGNAGPFDVGWSSPGTKTITLKVTKDICESPISTRSVTVEPRIQPVVLECPVTGATNITFDWNDVPNISGYVVTLDGTVITTPATSELVLTGLPTKESFTLMVEALSNTACPGTAASITCITEDCPPITAVFSQKDTTLCSDPNAALIPINVIITGGLQSPDQKITWSGTGVTQNPANDKQGFFDPKIGNLGVNSIIMTLVDGTCTKISTMKITIIDQPKSTFTGVNKLCISDPYILTYSGSPNLPLSWKSTPAGATITQVAGQPTKFNVVFPDTFTYKIDLVVGNIGCLSEVSSLTVDVDPLLKKPDIKCEVTTSTITFKWADIANATQYNIKLDGANRGNQSNLDFLVNNLMVGDTRTIIVTPISTNACPPIADTLLCTAKDCPDITLTASNPTPSFCIGSIATPIQLASTVIGNNATGSGSWSGPNTTTTGIVDPTKLDVGKFEFEYKYSQEGCTYNAKTSVTVYELPVLSLTTTDPNCYKQNVGYGIPTVVGGGGTYTYKLNNNAVTSDFGPQNPGLYTVLVTDQNQCTDEATFTINPAVAPTITTTVSLSSILSGQPVVLTAVTAGVVGTVDSIVWRDNLGNTICSGSLASCSVLDVAPLEDMTYCATLYFNNGCEVNSCVDAKVKKLVIITIPNIFKIDGDGKNGSFYVENYEAVKQVKLMQIFDRWGNLLFTAKNVPAGDPSFGWNGKFNGAGVVPGVYVYRIELELIDGTDDKYDGDLTVLSK
jgi:gliding motility-associated-like protein